MLRVGLAVVTLSALLVPSLALAQETTAAAPPAEAEEASDFSFEAAAATDVPVYVGARLSAELPHRLRLSTGIGILPGPYVELINAVATQFEGYTDETADLVEDTLQSSLVWRLHAGWRPFENSGFYFEGGYTLVTLGGTTSIETVIAVLSGQEGAMVEGRDPSEPHEYDISSTLHLVGFEAGYIFPIGENFTLRAALGGIFTVAASSTVENLFEARRQEAADRFNTGVEDYLNDTYKSYVHSPVVSVSVGYVF